MFTYEMRPSLIAAASAARYHVAAAARTSPPQRTIAGAETSYVTGTSSERSSAPAVKRSENAKITTAMIPSA